MSILKKKIKIRALEEIDYDDKLQVKTEDSSTQKLSKFFKLIQLINSLVKETHIKSGFGKKKAESKGEFLNSNSVRGTKIVRNYAKALCSFAYSDMALGYLQTIILKQYDNKVDTDGFRKYIKEKKGNTASISSLRGLLMETNHDSDKERIFKQIFAEISIIFIKFFSVNWIFSGKVKYRLEHVKYRHRMLRRIRNPEHFTYLKSSGG